MKTMVSNAQAPLLRAVQRLLTAAVTYDESLAVIVVVEAAVSVDWASATFIGQQHKLELRLEPAFPAGAGACQDQANSNGNASMVSTKIAAALASITAAIGEVEIVVPGHFVADIAVAGIHVLDCGAVCLTLEALTLLDD